MRPTAPRAWSRRDWLELTTRATAGVAAWAALPMGLAAQTGPAKDRRLVVHSDRPLDLETPPDLLDPFLTPLDAFYVRSHMGVPAIDAASWRLAFEGAGVSAPSLSLDELRRLPSTSVVATLECAGNGRAFFDPPVAGIQWRRGAVGTAKWTGVRLADLLRRAGLGRASYIWAAGADRPFGTQPPFVRQVPIAKAMDEHTLVAYAMNDAPLPADHGAPVRLIVPGWEGAYSVKWLSRLTASDKESDSFWVASAYRYPVSRVAPGAAVPADRMAPLTGLTVKSLITRPAAGTAVAPGPLRVAGYAWAGETAIARVDVSLDGGSTWQAARLTGARERYAWRRFDLDVRLTEPQTYILLSRATDVRGVTQPITPAWNPSGYLWNAPDEVRIEVKA